jgi:hypothetical protein
MMCIGSRLAVGAVLHDGENGEDAGHTQLYHIFTPAPPTPVSTMSENLHYDAGGLVGNLFQKALPCD